MKRIGWLSTMFFHQKTKESSTTIISQVNSSQKTSQMIPHKEYQQIRTEPDFLYQYFVKSGGDPVGPKQFSQLFGTWASFLGNPGQIIANITQFLDKQHNYSKIS